MLVERWSHGIGELAPPVRPTETEIDVLLSGRTLVDREGAGLRQSTLGRRGSVWISPSGFREDFVNVREPAVNCLHIFLPARPFAESMLEELDIDPARVTLRYESVAYDPFIEQIALAISQELSAETSAGRLLVESLGLSLSAYLVHRFAEFHLNAKPERALGKPIDKRRLSRVMEFIDAHIDERFTVAELAAEAFMSPAHFARSFKVTTGRSPHQYVSRIRLELARGMLADRDRSMADIAFSTGFSSQSNFTRAFRDASGVTPGDYRASQIGYQPPTSEQPPRAAECRVATL